MNPVPSRLPGRWPVLFTLLPWLCLGALGGPGAVIGPIPDQVIYGGGPQLTVPLQIIAPPDIGPITVLLSGGLLKAGFHSFEVYGSGTNWYLGIPAPSVALSRSLSNGVPFAVRTIAGGVTNQTDFMVSVIPGEFTAPTYLANLVIPQPVLADFNGDGVLDQGGDSGLAGGGGVIIQTSQYNSLRYFATAPLPTRKGATGIVPADINGDGRLDAVMLGNTTAPTELINLGNFANESFFPHINAYPFTLAITNLVGAAWADFDGDGDLDLVVTGTDATGQIPLPSRLVRNDGGGTLTMLDTALPAASGPVIAADFDGDGAVDLLLTNTGTQRDIPRLLRNDSQGGFTDTGTQFPRGPVTAAGWSDFNGDGLPDLWLQFKVTQGTTVATNELVLLQQQPDSRFAEIFRLKSDVMQQFGAPAFGDFDNDGTTDFVAPVNQPAFVLTGGDNVRTTVPGTNSIVTVWHNDGAGHFQPGGFVAANRRDASPVAGDIDGDGSLDLSLSSGFTTFFANPNLPANRRPATPGGLQAFAEGRSLFFFWKESTDPNQTAPLTYNLRVGTSPGANNIVASMSLNADGRRQVVAPGNCGFSTFREVRLALPLPTVDALYWTVQAVDNSFATSPFAPEQTLLVDVPGNLPPTIVGLQDVSLEENGAHEFQVTVTDDRTHPEEIVVRVTTSNPQLFPPGSITMPSVTNMNPRLHLLDLHPAQDVAGGAEVSVSATDRGGLTTTVTIHVAVVAPVVPGSQPALLVSSPARDGTLRFSLRGAIPPVLGLEQSEDLLHWSPVTGLSLDANGLPAAPVPPPAGQERLYYRLRTAQ